MALVVVGSNPIAHPKKTCRKFLVKHEHVTIENAPVAQLDRAADSGSACRGFESSQARH